MDVAKYQAQVRETLLQFSRDMFEATWDLNSRNEAELKLFKLEVENVASTEEIPFRKDVLELLVAHCDRRLELVNYWKAGSGKWSAYVQLSKWDGPLQSTVQREIIEEVMCDSRAAAVEKIHELAIVHAKRNDDLQYVTVGVYPENWEDKLHT